MSAFRVKFVTKDGSLVMNRPADVEYYIKRNGQPDVEFVEYILKADSRDRGVRVVSYTLTKEGLNAIVDWL